MIFLKERNCNIFWTEIPKNPNTNNNNNNNRTNDNNRERKKVKNKMSTKILITGFIWGYVFVLFEWKSGFNLFIFSFLSNNDWRKKYPSMINDQCVCVCKVSM